MKCRVAETAGAKASAWSFKKMFKQFKFHVDAAKRQGAGTLNLHTFSHLTKLPFNHSIHNPQHTYIAIP